MTPDAHIICAWSWMRIGDELRDWKWIRELHTAPNQYESGTGDLSHPISSFQFYIKKDCQMSGMTNEITLYWNKKTLHDFSFY